jgi:hypothetical protein
LEYFSGAKTGIFIQTSQKQKIQKTHFVHVEGLFAWLVLREGCFSMCFNGFAFQTQSLLVHLRGQNLVYIRFRNGLPVPEL